MVAREISDGRDAGDASDRENVTESRVPRLLFFSLRALPPLFSPDQALVTRARPPPLRRAFGAKYNYAALL